MNLTRKYQKTKITNSCDTDLKVFVYDFMMDWANHFLLVSKQCVWEFSNCV